VALQLEIDEELRRAGLAREIVRAVQDARKNAGLEITDRIALRLGGDPELLEIAEEHRSYIANETLATNIDQLAEGVRREDLPGDASAILYGDWDRGPSTTTIDSRELRISIRRV
jgi:hypothetical protein